MEKFFKFGIEEMFKMLGGFGNTQEENSHSYGLSCLGMDVFGPRLKLENNRL